jgi:single-strand DNA-binding protein
MVNKVILIGHLGKDPECKVLESGQMVANFSLATTEKFKDKNGNVQESTEWHNCQAWGKGAEVIEKYLKKGSKVFIEGKIKTRTYEKDGQTRYATEINVKEFSFLDSKPKDEF